MRLLRLLVPVLVFPALALAQDAPAPDPVAPNPVGTLLQDALPPGADLVVHVPSVPRFLESAIDAGFGTADAWRDAFRKQLTKWAEGGDAERLVRGGESLLRLADGEALVAAMELPRLGSPTAPRTRSFVLAMRSRAKEKELRAAVDDLIAGGLNVRYPAPPRSENVMGGRPAIALAGPHDGLWIRVEDHLIVATDHPISMGLVVRGLERVAREKRPAEDMSAFRLRVRWGRADSPQRWEGTTFLQREAVSAGTNVLSGGATTIGDDPTVVTYVCDDAADVPLFPARVPEEVMERAKRLSARPLAVQLLPDGSFTVGGSGGVREGGKPVLGGATRGAWLRAIAESRFISAVSLDSGALAGVLAAIDAVKPDVVPLVAEWRPGVDAGELRGPAWHGPVTFLALRTLRDIAHGAAPSAAPPPAPEPPPKPKLPPAPPPPPEPEREPGEAPRKPGDPLAPPDGR